MGGFKETQVATGELIFLTAVTFIGKFVNQRVLQKVPNGSWQLFQSNWSARSSRFSVLVFGFLEIFFVNCHATRRLRHRPQLWGGSGITCCDWLKARTYFMGIEGVQLAP
jgi:hypothetical protein